jgi:phage tail-like protein
MASYGKLTYKRIDDPPGPASETYSIQRGPNRIGRISRLGSASGDTKPASELVLPNDMTISADHALITAVETGCYITDLGSANPTKLNGDDIRAQVSFLLHDGHTIQIGSYLLRYEQRIEPDARASTWSHRSPDAATVRWRAERQRRAAAAIIPFKPINDTAYKLSHRPSEYLQYLPGLYHKIDLINNLLLSSEEVWRPIEEILDGLHWYTHPLLAPESMLNWIASWFEITLDAAWIPARRRQVISHAIKLLRWRGTRCGLIAWIELFTDAHVTIAEHGETTPIASPAPPLPANGFHIVVESTHPDRIDAEYLRRLIDREKPANTVYWLEIRVEEERHDDKVNG